METATATFPTTETIDPSEALTRIKALRAQEGALRKALEARRDQLEAELTEIKAQLGRRARAPRKPKAAAPAPKPRKVPV